MTKRRLFPNFLTLRAWTRHPVRTWREPPLVLFGAVALTVVLGLSRGALPPESDVPRARNLRSEAAQAAVCPAESLPDNGVCLPVSGTRTSSGKKFPIEKNEHRDREGNLVRYDQIPLQPGKPTDYRSYRFPIAALPSQDVQASGYDLHLPDSEQRRGAKFESVGHGGVDLAGTRGTEVRLVDLEHQSGPAEVVYVGWLFGNTVVTLHRVVQGGEGIDYLVIYGHLDAPAPGLALHGPAPEGTLLGTVGDSASPGDVHLHVEVRQLRRGASARDLEPKALVEGAQSIVCDPRNLFPTTAN